MGGVTAGGGVLAVATWAGDGQAAIVAEGHR
jgi:hypothetical protein